MLASTVNAASEQCSTPDDMLSVTSGIGTFSAFNASLSVKYTTFPIAIFVHQFDTYAGLLMLSKSSV